MFRSVTGVITDHLVAAELAHEQLTVIEAGFPIIGHPGRLAQRASRPGLAQRATAVADTLRMATAAPAGFAPKWLD